MTSIMMPSSSTDIALECNNMFSTKTIIKNEDNDSHDDVNLNELVNTKCNGFDINLNERVSNDMEVDDTCASSIDSTCPTEFKDSLSIISDDTKNLSGTFEEGMDVVGTSANISSSPIESNIDYNNATNDNTDGIFSKNDNSLSFNDGGKIINNDRLLPNSTTSHKSVEHESNEVERLFVVSTDDGSAASLQTQAHILTSASSLPFSLNSIVFNSVEYKRDLLSIQNKDSNGSESHDKKQKILDVSESEKDESNSFNIVAVDTSTVVENDTILIDDIIDSEESSLPETTSEWKRNNFLPSESVIDSVSDEKNKIDSPSVMLNIDSASSLSNITDSTFSHNISTSSLSSNVEQNTVISKYFNISSRCTEDEDVCTSQNKANSSDHPNDLGSKLSSSDSDEKQNNISLKSSSDSADNIIEFKDAISISDADQPKGSSFVQDMVTENNVTSPKIIRKRTQFEINDNIDSTHFDAGGTDTIDTELTTSGHMLVSNPSFTNSVNPNEEQNNEDISLKSDMDSSGVIIEFENVPIRTGDQSNECSFIKDMTITENSVITPNIIDDILVTVNPVASPAVTEKHQFEINGDMDSALSDDGCTNSVDIELTNTAIMLISNPSSTDSGENNSNKDLLKFGSKYDSSKIEFDIAIPVNDADQPKDRWVVDDIIVTENSATSPTIIIEKQNQLEMIVDIGSAHLDAESADSIDIELTNTAQMLSEQLSDGNSCNSFDCSFDDSELSETVINGELKSKAAEVKVLDNSTPDDMVTPLRAEPENRGSNKSPERSDRMIIDKAETEPTKEVDDKVENVGADVLPRGYVEILNHAVTAGNSSPNHINKNIVHDLNNTKANKKILISSSNAESDPRRNSSEHADTAESRSQEVVDHHDIELVEADANAKKVKTDILEESTNISDPGVTSGSSSPKQSVENNGALKRKLADYKDTTFSDPKMPRLYSDESSLSKQLAQIAENISPKKPVLHNTQKQNGNNAVSAWSSKCEPPAIHRTPSFEEDAIVNQAGILKCEPPTLHRTPSVEEDAIVDQAGILKCEPPTIHRTPSVEEDAVVDKPGILNCKPPTIHRTPSVEEDAVVDKPGILNCKPPTIHRTPSVEEDAVVDQAGILKCEPPTIHRTPSVEEDAVVDKPGILNCKLPTIHRTPSVEEDAVVDKPGILNCKPPTIHRTPSVEEDAVVDQPGIAPENKKSQISESKSLNKDASVSDVSSKNSSTIILEEVTASSVKAKGWQLAVPSPLCVESNDTIDDGMLVIDESAPPNDDSPLNEASSPMDVSAQLDNVVPDTAPQVVQQKQLEKSKSNIARKRTSGMGSSAKLKEKIDREISGKIGETKKVQTAAETAEENACNENVIRSILENRRNHLTRRQLEDLCVLKICETLTHKSELADLRRTLRDMEQTITQLKIKQQSMDKQFYQLKTVAHRTIEQIDESKVDGRRINPIKITRSVGLQVSAHPHMMPQTTNTATSTPSDPKNNTSTSTNISPSNNNVFVPSKNVSSSSKSPIVRTNSPSVVSPHRVAIKRTMPKVNAAPSAVIDLTKKDENTAKNSLNSQRSNAIGGNRITRAQIPMSNKVVTVPANSNSVLSRQMLKQSSHGGIMSNNNGTIYKKHGAVSYSPSTQHPAKLPLSPALKHGVGWKLPPPIPLLKIQKNDNGIMLSWSMSLNQSYANILRYQLYAYQETKALPTTDLWKKVGDVNALPLPMACTLTQFVPGHRYHFAVRAIDTHERYGAFSEPQDIML